MALRRRKVRPVVARLGLAALVLAAIAGVGAWAGTTLLSVRNDLAAVQNDLRAGADAAAAGDVEQASATFASASATSGDAVRQVHSPPVQLLGFLPVVGSTIDSVVAVTEAAHLIANAGDEVLGTLAGVPGGLDSLTVGGSDGAWLETVDRLTEPLTNAATMLDLAHGLVEAAPADTRVPEVDEARAQLMAELDTVVPAVHDANALLEVLPSLFGQNGTRRYFLGAQNPAELRGTGGLIGAYAIMTIEDGAVDIGSFRPVQELQKDVFTAEIAPNEEFFERYNPWITGVGTWLNVNMSPDFPAVAQTIQGMYLASEGEHLDGVIVVDPFALEAMLRATGPVTSPDPDIGLLEAETVVEYITNIAPIQLGTGGERKEVLGEAAQVIVQEFLSGGVGGQERLAALSRAVAGGHVLVHATDPAVQKGLEQVGAAGSLPAPHSMILALSIANLAEGKADFWLARTVEWDVSLESDGSASAIVTVTLSNSAPSDEQSIPQYIIGPGPSQPFARGDSVSLTSVHCGDCALRQTDYQDDQGFGTWIDTEAGHNVATTMPLIPGGEVLTVRHTFYLPNAWTRSANTGTFTPEFWTPASINGTEIAASFEPPLGWQFESAPDRMTVTDDGRLQIQMSNVRHVRQEVRLVPTP